MTNSLVISRNNFSKDSLVWLRIVILIQLIFLGFQIAFVVIMFQNEPKPVLFPLNNHDQLINSVPLSEPGLTDAELLNWATEAMIVSFSFNYNNYDNIAEKIEDYFDPAGIASYLKMISTHSQIQQLVSKKLILSGRPTAAPRLAQDGLIDGRYAWQILLPFILKFNNQKVKSESELTLEILIVRTTTQESSLGVKIVGIQDFKDSDQNKEIKKTNI